VKTEWYLFTGVAVFFGVNALGYGWFSSEPAGTAALAVACLMASLIAFFCYTNHRRRGLRPQDRGEAQVSDGTGPLEFFPPRSPWPVVTALAVILMALGVVYGLWLFLIGLGTLAPAVFGFVFQFADRQGSSSEGAEEGPAPTGGASTAGGGASTGGGGTSTRSR
jgi:uncharacterized membrane protein YgcG